MVMLGGNMLDCASSGFSSEGIFRILFRRISTTARLLNLMDSPLGQLSNQNGKIRLDMATGNEHQATVRISSKSTSSILSSPSCNEICHKYSLFTNTRLLSYLP